MSAAKNEIGDLLVANGVITQQELDLVQDERQRSGDSIIDTLARLGLAGETHLKDTLELNYGVNFVHLNKAENQPNPETARLLPVEIIKMHRAICINKRGNQVTLAMVDPSDTKALKDIKERLPGVEVRSVVCLEDEFMTCLDELFSEKPAKPKFPPSQSFSKSPTLAHITSISPAGEETDLTDRTKEQAIMRLADEIVVGAIKKDCSHIHIQPHEYEASVFYRKDGALSLDRRLPKSLIDTLITRYKFMARLNPAQRNVCQDGQIKMQTPAGEEVVCLISTVPMKIGEHVVFSILRHL